MLDGRMEWIESFKDTEQDRRNKQRMSAWWQGRMRHTSFSLLYISEGMWTRTMKPCLTSQVNLTVTSSTWRVGWLSEWFRHTVAWTKKPIFHLIPMTIDESLCNSSAWCVMVDPEEGGMPLAMHDADKQLVYRMVPFISLSTRSAMKWRQVIKCLGPRSLTCHSWKSIHAVEWYMSLCEETNAVCKAIYVYSVHSLARRTEEMNSNESQTLLWFCFSMFFHRSMELAEMSLIGEDEVHDLNSHLVSAEEIIKRRNDKRCRPLC